MIHVPDNATIATCRSLTSIRILSSLTAEGGRLDQLKAAAKSALNQKKATFAQSDLVIARLASNKPKTFVDARKLYELVKSKRITLEKFLDVICVRSSLLPPLLGGVEIEAISKPAANAKDSEDAGSLYTEFKPGVVVDFDAIEEAMLQAASGSGT